MRYEGELKGKAKQVKGTAKQQLGKLVDDPALHDEGSADRVEGKVQEKAVVGYWELLTFGSADRRCYHPPPKGASK
jgi:uncharacterized protein YjbJ (UPF0337 family)